MSGTLFESVTTVDTMSFPRSLLESRSSISRLPSFCDTLGIDRAQAEWVECGKTAQLFSSFWQDQTSMKPARPSSVQLHMLARANTPVVYAWLPLFVNGDSTPLFFGWFALRFRTTGFPGLSERIIGGISCPFLEIYAPRFARPGPRCVRVNATELLGGPRCYRRIHQNAGSPARMQPPALTVYKKCYVRAR